MLARVVNDYACLPVKRGVFECIASMLAPTEGSGGSPRPTIKPRLLCICWEPSVLLPLPKRALFLLTQLGR